ncbi:MAG: protein kinase domain-containing protein, partial [Nannocystaceae bacterium]
MSTSKHVISFEETLPGLPEEVSWEGGGNDESALVGLEGPPRIGRYVFLERIGEGGMGVVIAAFDPKLDRKVAIKLIHKVSQNDSDRRRRMEREARSMARLSHPNVVTVYEVGEYFGQLFVAMEFINGQDLRAWVHSRGETADWHDTLDILVQAGRGLAAAHLVGLVHRDFKPGNVFVGKDRRARVGDFGLALHASDAADTSDSRKLAELDDSEVPFGHTLTATGVTVGTPAYMAPEQFLGKHVDARSDQFAFCVAAWEALYGERPFTGANFAELLGNVTAGNVAQPPSGTTVPDWVRTVLTRGLMVAPVERWSSMDELLGELQSDPVAARKRVYKQMSGMLMLMAVVGILTWIASAAQDRAVLAHQAAEQAKQEHAREFAGLRQKLAKAHEDAEQSQRQLQEIRDRVRMSVARRYGARDNKDPLDDPTTVAALLAEVDDPNGVEGWFAAANAALDRPLSLSVSRFSEPLYGLDVAPGMPLGLVVTAREVVLTRRVDGRLTRHSPDGWGVFGRGIHDAVISDNATMVAAAGDRSHHRNVVMRWSIDKEPHEDQKISEPEVLVGQASELESSPDGRYLAGFDRREGVVRVWQPEQVKPLLEVTGVTQMCLQGLDNLVTGHSDGRVKIWQLGDLKSRVIDRHTGSVDLLTCSDQQPEVASSSDQRVRLWHQQRPGQSFTHTAKVDAITWARAGDVLIVLDAEGRLLAREAGQRPHKLGDGPQAWIGRIAGARVVVSRDSQLVAQSAGDVVRVWAANELDQQPWVLSGHRKPITGVAFESESILQTVALDGAVRRWQLPLATSHILALDSGEALHGWLKNGRLLTSLASEARLRDPSSGNTLVLPPVVSRRGEVKVAFVGPVAESESGEVVACGMTHGQVAVWRLKEGIWEGSLVDAHPGPEVTALAIAGDGSMLVQGASDGSLRWWRTNDQTVVRNAQPHQGSVTAVIARPGSAGFVTTSVDGTIQQWAANGAGGIVGSVKGPIEGLSLNPDGSILLARSSARGSSVYVVATEEKIPVRYLSGPMHAIETAMFTKGGNVVATLSADGAARTWDFLHRLSTNTVVVDLDGPTAIGPNGVFVAA